MMRTRSRRHPLGDPQEGATAIEYALIASLVAAAIAVSVALVGTEVGLLFERVASAFTDSSAP